MARTMSTNPHKKSRRGLAAMSPEQRKRITSMGGKARAALGLGHRFTHEEAVAAGRKGGKAKAALGVGFTHEEAVAAGRKGGKAKAALGVGFTHEEAVAAGRKGGKAAHVLRPGFQYEPGKWQRLILDELARRDRFPLNELFQANRGTSSAENMFRAARRLARRGLIETAKDGRRVICIRVEAEQPKAEGPRREAFPWPAGRRAGHCRVGESAACVQSTSSI